ncbi:hypothetical protein F0259_11675 [Vibrio cyclitrophicus]|uniref:hypothetical protein n=1 Tax=Vibrio cyclitrophicus TaxID=47951 RepID=UPI00148D046A|nr:hypothetical protein [Vibrio cyclitrophicus]NOH44467.1 hypothetical protein [Vibrio cyclitrophicus]
MSHMLRSLHLKALEGQVNLKVKNLCSELKTVERIDIKEKDLNAYIKQATHAVWLDYQTEAKDMNITFAEKEEDLIDRVISDVTTFIRRNALIIK